MSKITIITPIYNHSEFIQKLYVKMINQTLEDWEWIVIDDGSTDNIWEILNKWPKDNRITKIKRDHSGCCNTINYGLELAKYPYLSVIGADDYPMLNFMQKFYDKITSKDFDVVVSNYIGYKHEFREVDLEKQKKGKRYQWESFSPSYLLKTEVIKKLKFDPELENFSDLKLWIIFLTKGYKIGYIRECLFTNVRTGNSLTGRITPEVKQEKWNKFYAEFPEELCSKLKKIFIEDEIRGVYE